MNVPAAPPLGLETLAPATNGAVTPELVLREIRAHDFAILSTVDENGQPDAARVAATVSIDRVR
jgi:hypothetical protein